MSKVESKINQIEKEIKNDDVALETNYEVTASDPNFFDLYHAKKAKLEDLMMQWETVQEEIENFNN